MEPMGFEFIVTTFVVDDSFSDELVASLGCADAQIWPAARTQLLKQSKRDFDILSAMSGNFR
jgi:hypothetical protein